MSKRERNLAAFTRKGICQSPWRLQFYSGRLYRVRCDSTYLGSLLIPISEAIEDLTGGVTTELFTSDILDTDKFWTDEIMKVNQEFLFGCATGVFDNWQGENWMTDRKDIVSMHAYSILAAKEVKGERLLRVRNPWGKFEWKGAWSDGSEQWTPEWMQLLDHKFGGKFSKSLSNFLRYFCRDRESCRGPRLLP